MLYFGYPPTNVLRLFSSSYRTSIKEFCITFYRNSWPNVKFDVICDIGLTAYVCELRMFKSMGLGVCELMGRVRNVVLIECTLGLGKPKRGRDFGWEGTLAGDE